MDNGKIGLFIKKLRLKNNMSQNDLAEKIPTDRSAISKWECGKALPNSTTILRLCEIFEVSIDELLCGEFKTEENSKEFKSIYLRIYDEKNKYNYNLKKVSKALLISLIILAIFIILFFCQYFFKTYDSVKVYNVESDSKNVYLTDGIFVLTRGNIYFRLGNINGIDNEDIIKQVLYYKKNNNKDIIYEITSSKDRLIIDSIKYKKYFKIINNKPNFDNLYLDIYTSASVITLNLSLSEDYSNMELFHQKWK